jgi:hypothetical protein
MESSKKDPQPIDPVSQVAKALEELNVDYKQPGFTKEDALKKFMEVVENPKASNEQVKRFSNLVKVCGERKFWNQQLV